MDGSGVERWNSPRKSFRPHRPSDRPPPTARSRISAAPPALNGCRACAIRCGPVPTTRTSADAQARKYSTARARRRRRR